MNKRRVLLVAVLLVTGACLGLVFISAPQKARADPPSPGYDLYPWINTFLFENIKEAGTYTGTENDFVADHYDIASAHLQVSNNDIQTRNPNVKIIPFTGWAQVSSCDWCARMRQQFFQAHPEYDEETIYLHNKCDTVQNSVTVKGFNAANVGLPAPGCSASTATSLSEARRPDPDATYHSLGWYVAYFVRDAYKAFAVWSQQQSLSYYGSTHPAHGLFQDNILDGSGPIPEIEKTIEYWNQPYVPNVMHQRDADQLAFYEYVTAQVEGAVGRQLFWIGNINHLWWVRPEYFWFPWVSTAENLDLFASENWSASIFEGENSTPAWNTDCAYLHTAWDYTTNFHKGVALVSYNWKRGQPGVAPDPFERAFSLASYYLIKNPLLYYSYSESETSADLLATEWNPMAEADLGQPRQNPPGVVDFDGATGTDTFFDWNHQASAPSCTIYDQSDVVMARHFENGLVLAKYKGRRGTCGTDCTSYVDATEYSLANPYGASYFIVQPDGTLSADPITSVTLVNNQAVILITDINDAPVLAPIGNKTLNEGDVFSFQVTATDEDLGDTLTLTASNLPSGAVFVNNGDRTGTFSWTPTTEQAGSYPNVHFQVSDGTDTVSEDITITVVDGFASCTPNWTCSDWPVCSNSLQSRTCSDQNSCGTDTGRPSESRACDSTAPGAISDLRTG
jgi:hypothetical protein